MESDVEENWEQTFEEENEFNVMERVGFLEIDERLLQKRIHNTPEQNFYVNVNAFCRKLLDDGVLPHLKDYDIKFMLEHVNFVPNSGYKNPVAYILGYWVSKDGTINKHSFKEVTKVLKLLDPPVKQTDVLRYSNLWISLL